MKPRVLFLVLGAVVIGGGGAWWLWSSRDGVGSRPAVAAEKKLVPAVPAGATKPGLNTSVDAVAVFQRAFWRKPDATVRILHAERREWAGEKVAVEKWQWFVALESQPAFRQWLLEENPFGLVRVAEDSPAAEIAAAPAWFPALKQLQSFTRYHVPGAGFRVFVDAASGRLYATDAGAGFVTAAR
jgi:hypothetical protein